MIQPTLRGLVVALSTVPSVKIALGRALEAQFPPYITIDQVSGPRGSTHCGPDGTAISRYQISVFGSTYGECKQLAEEIYPLQNHTGGTIAKITLDNEVDIYDPEGELHQVALDFMVFHY